jgi:hypothetical protein
MQEGEVTKSITRKRPISSTSTGNPKLKWEDDVMLDIQSVKIKSWRRIAMISRWNEFVEQARTHQGL